MREVIGKRDAFEKLESVQARITAWREFFSAGNLLNLRAAKARIIHFNEYQPFKNCCIEFEGSPEAAQRAVELMLKRAGSAAQARQVQFVHERLADGRASIELPLTAFGAQSKAVKDCTIWFGVYTPLTVRGSEFEMKCVLDSHGKRWGRLYWRNPQAPQHISWAAELRLPRATTRKEMRAALIEAAASRLGRHVTAIEME